jgi:hypothetical protein
VNNSRDVPKSHSRVFLTLECLYESRAKEMSVVILVSSAGSVPTQAYDWPLRHGQPSAAQLDDITSVVAELVHTATVSFVGVQEVLPLA